ncbi:hypothetical protein [Nostoc sp. NMS1]|uniref:hypothetical protein n=1 Tax=Nostoc sp. NMS1 TaxID=2815388 RepID=UPI0025CC7727|nr:hypothetical protein [Nostoc sp. NMS1]
MPTELTVEFSGRLLVVHHGNFGCYVVRTLVLKTRLKSLLQTCSPIKVGVVKY